MNRVLAETLTLLNGLIAVVIVIVGLVGGNHLSGGALMGTVAGGIVGFLIAALTCGTLAYLALIERHLAKIANARISPTEGDHIRRDPIL